MRQFIRYVTSKYMFNRDLLLHFSSPLYKHNTVNYANANCYILTLPTSHINILRTTHYTNLKLDLINIDPVQ